MFGLFISVMFLMGLPKDRLHQRFLVSYRVQRRPLDYLPAFRVVPTEKGNLQPELLGGAV